jgi:hypothetical protein
VRLCIAGLTSSPRSSSAVSSWRPLAVRWSTRLGTSVIRGFSPPVAVRISRTRLTVSAVAIKSSPDGPQGITARSDKPITPPRAASRWGGLSRMRKSAAIARMPADHCGMFWFGSSGRGSTFMGRRPGALQCFALPCVSQSISTVERPRDVISAAKWTAVVVFPDPPLRPHTPTICIALQHAGYTGAHPCELQ